MDLLDCRPRGEAICRQLIAEIRKLGFPEESLPPLPAFEQAGFAQPKDPQGGLESLCGVWRNGQGYRVGEITFHPDGSFYAEYDVVLPHPANARWFVESVIAWGRGDLIKSEAKLLPALG